MGKFFNKMINGDPNKKDFTKSDLPSTRFELFFDVLKQNLLGLISLNLLYLVFLLPLGLFIGLFATGIVDMATSRNPGDLIAGLKGIAVGEYIGTMMLAIIPLYTIAGPAKAGMNYVIRNWSWGERSTVWHDFWKEFKRSWKKAALYNFLVALFFNAVVFWVRLLILNSEEGTISGTIAIIAACVLAIVVIIFFLMSIYVYPQMVTFEAPLLKNLKNSLIFGIMQLPATIFAIIAIALVYSLCFFAPEILAVIMLGIGFTFISLGKMVYCNFVFDKYIKYLTNADVPTRRGMAPLKKAENNEENTD